MEGKFSAVLAAVLAASVSAAAFASCAQPAQPGGPDAEGLPQARPARGFGMYPAAADLLRGGGALAGWFPNALGIHPFRYFFFREFAPLPNVVMRSQ